MLHAQGRIARAAASPVAEEAAARASRCEHWLDGTRFYDALWRAGYHLGPGFAWIDQIARGPGEAVCTFRSARPVEAGDGFGLPPGVLDSAFQSLLVPRHALPSDGALVPLHIRRLVVGGAARAAASCQVVVEAGDDTSITGSVTLLDARGEAVSLVEGLALRFVPREALIGGGDGTDDDRISALCHVVGWEALPAVAPATVGGRGRWLVVADEQGVGDALAARLVAAGYTCITARLGEPFVLEGSRATLNPLDPEHFRRVLQSAQDMPWSGVVHLSALDATPAAATDETTLMLDGRRDMAGYLHAAQAIAQLGTGRLWVAVGRVSAESAATAPLSAGLLPGIGRTVALEHPDIWGGVVELHDLSAEAAAAALAAEITADHREDWVAYEGAQRLGARLRNHVRVAEKATPPLRAEGSYLVTGGLGGLGLHVARWLVDHGARHIVLVGRRPADEAATAWIRDLEQRGAAIRVRTADITVRADVAALFAEVTAASRPSLWRDPRGGGGRGRPSAGNTLEHGRRRDAPQGGGRLASPRGDAPDPPRLLRPVLLRRGAHRPSWPGGLCSGERFHGSPGAASSGARSAGVEHCVGSLGRRRHGSSAGYHRARSARRARLRLVAARDRTRAARSTAGNAGAAASSQRTSTGIVGRPTSHRRRGRSFPQDRVRPRRACRALTLPAWHPTSDDDVLAITSASSPRGSWDSTATCRAVTTSRSGRSGSIRSCPSTCATGSRRASGSRCRPRCCSTIRRWQRSPRSSTRSSRPSRHPRRKKRHRSSICSRSTNLRRGSPRNWRRSIHECHAGWPRLGRHACASRAGIPHDRETPGETERQRTERRDRTGGDCRDELPLPRRLERSRAVLGLASTRR